VVVRLELELQRFGNRVGAYMALMDDRYPATDQHQSVHLDHPYPDAQHDLNRWLPLVKWLLAIPHYIDPLARPGDRLRLGASHRPLPAVPPGPVRRDAGSHRHRRREPVLPARTPRRPFHGR
jgi:diadenosine tetraphosphatase ApaH/serine/threonine PP2A family protein phosphatase